MGNSCYCNTNHYTNDIKINICLDNLSQKDKSQSNTKKKDNKLQGKSLLALRKYFDEGEKEIINNLNKKEKAKKNMKKKKRDSFNQLEFNEKYELMLKRLLDVQKIKRNGPKRRDTCRDQDKIKTMVKDILTENKNEIKNSIMFMKKKSDNNTLIIRNKNQGKFRASVTIEKHGIINELQGKNMIINKLLQNATTLLK